MTKIIQKGMITPWNTPAARFEAVSEKLHLNLEGMQVGSSNYGFWFLKTGIKFQPSLPVKNQNSVLHQKLLSLVGLRLDLAPPLEAKSVFLPISSLFLDPSSDADLKRPWCLEYSKTICPESHCHCTNIFLLAQIPEITPSTVEVGRKPKNLFAIVSFEAKLLSIANLVAWQGVHCSPRNPWIWFFAETWLHCWCVHS